MQTPSPTILIAPLFVVVWATGFVVARLVTPHADPITFLCLRFGGVLPVLLPAALILRARWPDARQGWRDGIVAGILLHGFYLCGIFWAVSHGLPAGISALIAGLQPVFTAALSRPLLGERVSGRRWLGILTGFLGVLLVIAPRLAGGPGGFGVAVVLVSLVSTLSATLGSVWQKRTAAEVDLRANAVLQHVGAILVAAPLASLTETGRIDPVPEFWIGLAWGVFVLSIGGVGLLLVLLRGGAVAGVAALLYLVPPVTAVMSFVLFGETLSPVQIVGMAVAAVGVALASRR